MKSKSVHAGGVMSAFHPEPAEERWLYEVFHYEKSKKNLHSKELKYWLYSMTGKRLFPQQPSFFWVVSVMN